MKRIAVFALLLALAPPSCVVVGYSNKGGWFLWPGGLGLLIIVAVVVLLLARRRR